MQFCVWQRATDILKRCEHEVEPRPDASKEQFVRIRRPTSRRVAQVLWHSDHIINVCPSDLIEPVLTVDQAPPREVFDIC